MNVNAYRIFSLVFLFCTMILLVGAGDGDPKKKKKKKKNKKGQIELVVSVPVPGPEPEAAEPYTYSAAADPFGPHDHSWADSVFRAMTPRERLGQLFMVAAYSNRDEKHFREIDSLVSKYRIGGLIFMQGGPMRQAQLTNRWQFMAKVPLLLSMDAEWGLGMRLDSTVKFPKQMTLGALPHDSLVYQMGAEIARQFRRIGMQVNFAPVADVNNNPANPVINTRSFGENKHLVTRRALAYMRGLQDNKVLATAKHFPGHGDTDTDSHLALPVINAPRERLDTLELMPFRRLFEAGIGSVMVAHLFVPSVDTTTNLASTLSPRLVNDLLKKQMNYRGLIFTDALNMKGVSSFYSPGEVDLKALLAGNDVLLFSENVPRAMALIDSALQVGMITQQEIDEHCMKILRVKQWTDLRHTKFAETANLTADLNTGRAEQLSRLIKRQALTLAENKGMIPLVGTQKVACLAIGEEQPVAFQRFLAPYGRYDWYNVPKNVSDSIRLKIIDSLKSYEKVVIAVVNTNLNPQKNFGFADEGISLVDTLAGMKEVALVLFANPYALLKLKHADKLEAVVIAYQDDEDTQAEAAQLVGGRMSPTGTLPVTSVFPRGAGSAFKALPDLGYAHPAETGIDAVRLARIDSIVKAAIKEEAFPGCQVLVARKGKIIYSKSFGHYTYEKLRPVESSSIYDLASLTKILSTTIAAMKLYEKGKLDLEATLGDYLSFIPRSNPHAAVKIKDALLHQAGFVAWIPFYEKYTSDSVAREIFSSFRDADHPWRVAEHMYVPASVKDSIFNSILSSPLNPAQGYKYSDLGFYYMREVIEHLSGKRIEDFVQDEFYAPMQLPALGYRPLERFAKDRIVPTEYDESFRMQLVHGDVHDQGAALMGGVSGHAGLFGTSFDVAAIMQMLLNEGQYNGKRYLLPATVRLFTATVEKSQMPKNRRALGFDKPVRDGSNGPTFNGISYHSYGHSGFTGTYTWADPAEEIVYVFLSNRVYPVASNNKLVRLGVRTEIQKAVYDAILESYKDR